jgi:hypothetical protein
VSWTPELAAKFYNITLFDYGEGRQGTLIASGSGLAMAIMDSTNTRYMCDIDAMDGDDVAYRVAQFAEMACALSGNVAFAGWYSLRGNCDAMYSACQHVRALGYRALWYDGGSCASWPLATFLSAMVARQTDQ